MKISCLTENINRGLNITSRIVSTKPTLPVLGNILIETSKGFLKLSSTNLEIGLICKIGAKIEEEGSLTIPARLFTEYINSLPNKKINLEVKDNNLNIKCDYYKATIKGIPSSEFPLIPKIEESPLISISPKILTKGIEPVVFATAINDSRPVLSGVFLNFKGNKLKLVATDSYRLSEKIISLKNNLKEEKSVIIPSRTMQELLRLLEGVSSEVEITISENQIMFHLDDVEFISRLIEGNFPTYEQIIPDSYETKTILPREEFINAIKRASLFAREAANSIKLNLKKGEIQISAATTQIGEVNSTLEVKTEGPEAEISFNAKYLLDVLGCLKEDNISLEIAGKLAPGVIRPEGVKDYIHIIMPLRT